MLTIPHKKLKSHEATMEYLLDPARLKTFILELRAYLKSTQHLCVKEGRENDPRYCVHRDMYYRPDTVLFRRFNYYCSSISLDWNGALEMLEIMIGDRFMCECELVWGLSDKQLEERLAGKK